VHKNKFTVALNFICKFDDFVFHRVLFGVVEGKYFYIWGEIASQSLLSFPWWLLMLA